MSASKVAALLQSAPKRTLSELLGQLPKLGVGTCVARDTWHPESGKFWEITRVQPKKGGEEGHLDVWGIAHWHGQRAHALPKQIASVWKHGWQLRPRSDNERAALEALLDQAQDQAQEQSPPQEVQQ